MDKRFIINGDNINSIETFYNEINNVFMKNQSFLISNLDGLEDLFNGGIGEINDQDESIQIVWKQYEKNRKDLGIDLTIQWYEMKIQTIPHNSSLFNKKIQQLKDGTGETYFDIIMEIIDEHPNVVLIKE